MNDQPDFLLYGSYGYTGCLIAEAALAAGLRPRLAGRDAARLHQQAEALGLDYSAFSLDQPGELEAAVRQVPLVMHAAGPYVHTSAPMVQACLQGGAHYVDLTGEIPVFEALAALDEPARRAGVVLLPGAGFDVVPSDCLAYYLKQRLPSATHLDLAVRTLGSGSTHGTALSALGIAGQGGLVRRGGRLLKTPLASQSRLADLGRGPVELHLAPLADLVSAWHSTGIPDITTYLRLPRAARRLAGALRIAGSLLGTAPAQALARAWIRRQPAGPTPEQRRTGRSIVWGEAWDEQGQRATARLETPEAYHLTAQVAVVIVQRLLAEAGQPGYQTPAKLFGADFIMQFARVSRVDLPE